MFFCIICIQRIFQPVFLIFWIHNFYYIFVHIYSIWTLNHGHYPYKWLWIYGGVKFLKLKAHKKIHRRMPTTYYYSKEVGRLVSSSHVCWLVCIHQQHISRGITVLPLAHLLDRALWSLPIKYDMLLLLQPRRRIFFPAMNTDLKLSLDFWNNEHNS